MNEHKKRNRERFKEQGGYDGRYKTKVIPNKKKKKEKGWSREPKLKDFDL